MMRLEYLDLWKEEPMKPLAERNASLEMYVADVVSQRSGSFYTTFRRKSSLSSLPRMAFCGVKVARILGLLLWHWLEIRSRLCSFHGLRACEIVNGHGKVSP